MITKKKKSDAVKFLEKLTGGPLTIGNLIESIRLGEDISQTKFAAKLGVSKSYLCDIEKGRKFVSTAKAAQIATVLGYSKAQFIRLALQEEIERLGFKFKVSLDPAA